MAIQIVKRKNFSAPLPADFYALKSLTCIDGSKNLIYTQYPRLYVPPDKYEFYMIRLDMLYFSGRYSKWLIVKWFQKLKEQWFPIRYRLEYLSVNDISQ